MKLSAKTLGSLPVYPLSKKKKNLKMQGISPMTFLWHRLWWPPAGPSVHEKIYYKPHTAPPFQKPNQFRRKTAENDLPFFISGNTCSVEKFFIQKENFWILLAH